MSSRADSSGSFSSKASIHCQLGSAHGGDPGQTPWFPLEPLSRGGRGGSQKGEGATQREPLSADSPGGCKQMRAAHLMDRSDPAISLRTLPAINFALYAIM